MFENQVDYLRNNHLAMMAACCLLPVIVIFGLQLAGVRDWWVYPLALAFCVGGHALLMALPNKEGKTCH